MNFRENSKKASTKPRQRPLAPGRLFFLGAIRFCLGSVWRRPFFGSFFKNLAGRILYQILQQMLQQILEQMFQQNFHGFINSTQPTLN